VNRLLVMSVVHQADDPRVRLRTVGVLAQKFEVRYATRPPGPADRGDHAWVGLRGQRLVRHLGALREAMRRDVRLLSLHDPELIPLGLLVRMVRRIPVVLDVHEDVPSQLRTKLWLPSLLRRPVARLAATMLGIAERRLAITLAEPGYARLFRDPHPVLPNYPLVDRLPPLAPAGDDIVYVGDVTEARGAIFAIDVVARMRTRHRLRLIGRCADPLRLHLREHAAERGVDLDLPGFVSHGEAMRAVAVAAAGLCPLEDQPNYHWSLPTKVLEYLALGVPVVASDLPGTAELVEGRPGVQLVGPRDAEAWAQALERAVSDPAWREQAVSGARDVREDFNWPANRLLETYIALWEPSPGASGRALGGVV
jgi:glycosyltransferase involved in cell wall biosynthesis